MKHKPGKLHVIPDVLLRFSKNTSPPTITENVFDVDHTCPIVEYEPLPVYHIILIKMADELKTRLKQVYQNNKQWKRIFDLVHPQNGENNPPIPERLRFQYPNGFIYYTNEYDGRKRFCIPKTSKKKIEFAYDKQNHGNFHKIYDKITVFIYVRKFSRYFQQYIAYCPECQLK